MHPFRSYILQFTSIEETEWNAIELSLTRKEYKAGTTLLRAGDVCKKLYFVEEGLLRFFILKGGVDVSKFFTVAPYCFTSQKSFTDDIPSADSIETLEDSVIWEMNKTDAFDLLRLASWNSFVRMLIQEVQFNTEQLLEALQNETAEDRYLKMLESGDPLLNRIPLKHIASFLGIAPQSLSRIRKKMLQKNRT
jgi:CRP-like cAMP-binding protein